MTMPSEQGRAALQGCLRRLATFNRQLGKVELGLSTACLGGLLLADTLAVAGRVLFAIYPAWVIEVSVMLVIYTVFAGGAYLYKIRGHVAVTLLLDRLDHAGRAHRVLVVLGEMLVLLFALVTLWQAAIYQPILAARATTALQIPQNIVTLMIPIAYLSILLAALETLLAQVLDES
jgi:TRAP-type C4-dicarboxylate transport system permease small subunit